MTMRNAPVPAALASLLLLSGCPGENTTTGPACKSLLAGDLVITEVMANPKGDDSGKEWMELHNPTAKDISLSGISLFVSNADGSSEKALSLPKTLSLPAGKYLAMGDVRDGATPPPWIGYAYGDGLKALPNSSGAVGVRCGTNVLDKFTWNQPAADGKSLSLNGALVPDSAANDNADNLCTGTSSYDTDMFGTPGQKNDPCGSPDGGCVGSACGTCFDSALNMARPAVLPSNPGDLVISEFMANPSSTDTGKEWFELFATRDVDLNGLEVTAGSNTDTLASANCLHVPAGSYAVIANSTDAGVNGGLPLVTTTTTVTLGNATSSPGSLSVSNGGVVVDSISWGAAAAASGVSSQLDPLKLDAELNDGADAFCPATQAYGAGDKGTPGTANSACASAPAGDTCVDAATGQSRPLMPPAVGDLVITELLQNTAGTDADQEWFEVLVKADVDLNGLKLGNEGNTGTALNSTTCIHPGPNTWVVFARKADPAVNGGLPQVTATIGFGLANTGPRSVKVMFADGGLLDQVTYDTAQVKESTSWQLDFNNLDNIANDSVASFCFTDAGTYSATAANTGTPGAPNVRCQ
ncbi:MAG: lamin tail domain-containing protein [Deltaproteobacteria bacterium]|nr:lamin tail domain-containing protein [Deltaproteobacteria bacterium]